MWKAAPLIISSESNLEEVAINTTFLAKRGEVMANESA